MTEHYNPIVRIFGRLRFALRHYGGISRERIRPRRRLEDLLPCEHRRDIWRCMQHYRIGRSLPSLKLRPETSSGLAILVIGLTIVMTLLSGNAAGLLLVVPLGWIAYKLSRPWASEIPLGLCTVGELTLYLIQFREHRDSGYRWTRNEVALKVRMLIAEHFGFQLREVQRKCKFTDLC